MVDLIHWLGDLHNSKIKLRLCNQHWLPCRRPYALTTTKSRLLKSIPKRCRNWRNKHSILVIVVKKAGYSLKQII